VPRRLTSRALAETTCTPLRASRTLSLNSPTRLQTSGTHPRTSGTVPRTSGTVGRGSGTLPRTSGTPPWKPGDGCRTARSIACSAVTAVKRPLLGIWRVASRCPELAARGSCDVLWTPQSEGPGRARARSLIPGALADSSGVDRFLTSAAQALNIAELGARVPDRQSAAAGNSRTGCPTGDEATRIEDVSHGGEP
jgi:hypothetical protein